MQRKTKITKDADQLVVKIIDGKRVRQYKAKEVIFSQGNASNAVFFIQKGKVKQEAQGVGRAALIGTVVCEQEGERCFA